MQILDGFLDPNLLLSLRAALKHPSFPWERTKVLSPSGAGALAEEQNVQFVHGFYRRREGRVFQSRYLPLVLPVVNRLAPQLLVKVKVNLTLPRADHLEYGLHVDTRWPGARTAILYLNTNDGYTVFEDGTRVPSLENRLLVFDAALRHTGASCTDVEARLVLNMNFVPRPGLSPG